LQVLSKNPLFRLFIVATLWFFTLSFLLQFFNQTYYFPDSLSYLVSAKQLYLENTVNAQRPFLFSMLNGFPLLFSNSDAIIFRFNFGLNILAWYATIVLVYKIVSKIILPKTAFFFTIGYIFSVGSVAICFHFLTEPIFTFLLVWMFYYLQKFEHSKQIKYLIFAFSILLISLLIKPILQFFVLLFLLFYVQNVFDLLKSKWIFFLVLPIFFIFFQMYSMQKTYGRFTLTYIDTITYYNYLGTRAENLRLEENYDFKNVDREIFFDKLNYEQQKVAMSDDIRFQLKTNKINLVKAYFINIYSNSIKGSASIHAFKNQKNTSYFEFFWFLFKGISKIQNILFTILGIVISVYSLLQWKRSSNFIKINSFTVLYIFVISGISSDQGDRLHLVFYPLVVFLIANYFYPIKSFFVQLQK
jgi:hypothetical protein